MNKPTKVAVRDVNKPLDVISFHLNPDIFKMRVSLL